MFGFNTKSCLLTGIVLCELLGWSTLEARVTGEYYFGLNAEDHSDDPNETTSLLGLNISDDLLTPNSQTSYELESLLVYDRENDVTNDQYTGSLTGRYVFLQPSLWWNYSGEVDVIPLDTGMPGTRIEVDNLRSQNLSTFSTGPTISLWKNLRGSVDVTALANITNYSDTNLDSSGSQITLDYIYPYSKIASLTYSLDYETVDYDDAINATDDFDLVTAGITIDRATEISSFELILEYSNLDNINNSSTQNAIELNLGYQLNAISNLSMEISSSLETADEFNTLGDNPDNAIFRSGLFRNERYQLGYGYVTADTRFEFHLYTNQLESIFDAIASTEKVSGAVIEFDNDITDTLNLFIGLESTDLETLNERTDELVVAATYTRRHSERFFSEIELSIEKDRVDNVDSNDTTLVYRFTSTLF